MYSNSMQNSTMRRNSNAVRTVGIVVASLLFLYGIYAYHDLHTRHKRNDEKLDRLRQQHDSLSAQLQVVYEQKSRLDKLLQQEKADHKQSKDDLGTEKKKQEMKFQGEKQELLNRIKSISSEHKMLQNQHDDLQSTFTKLQDQFINLENDCKNANSQHTQEFLQMKQEKDNELARVRDDVANLQRRNTELQSKLQLAIQQSQVNQGNLVANMNQLPLQQQHQQHVPEQQQPLQQQQSQQQQSQQQPQQQQYQQQPQQQQQPLQQQPQQLYQLQPQQLQPLQQQPLQQQPQQQLYQLQPQQQPLQQQPLQQHLQQNKFEVQIPEQHDVFGVHNNLVQDHKAQQMQGLLHGRVVLPGQVEKDADRMMVNGDSDQGPVMQMAQPGEGQKPYFDPKKAYPDHELDLKVDQPGEVHNAGGVINQEQVAPPHSDNEKVEAFDEKSHERVRDMDNADIPHGLVPPGVDQVNNKAVDHNLPDANDDIMDDANDDDNAGDDYDDQNNDQVYNAGKGDERIVGHAGAIGAERVANDNMNIQAPRMLPVQPPQNGIEAPDGVVNVDNNADTHIGRGQGVLLNNDDNDNDDYYNDKHADDNKPAEGAPRILNAIKPAMAGDGL